MSERDINKDIRRLLDYRLGLDDPAARRETERLLVDDAEAGELNRAVGRMLEPLASFPDCDVPDGLSDRTMDFIRNHSQARTMAAASAAIVSSDSRKSWLSGNIRELVALAACLMFVFLVYQPGTQRFLREVRPDNLATGFRQAGLGLGQYSGNYSAFSPDQGQWSYMFPGVSGGLSDYFRSTPAEQSKKLLPSGQRRIRLRISPELLEQMRQFASQHDSGGSIRLIFDRGGSPLSTGSLPSDAIDGKN